MKSGNKTQALARIAAVGLGLLIPTFVGAQSAGQWKSPEMIFAKVCGYCHDKSRADKIGPELMGRKLAAAYVLYTARHGRGGMPAFPESVISPAELAGLAQMIENSAAPTHAAQGQH
jgi:mono/diheme cytochrome c family protein